MKKILVLVAIVVSFSFAQSTSNKISDNLLTKLHTSVENQSFLIWIYFSDKGNDIEKYLSNPTSVISEKSLKRRKKLDSESSIEISDLPVHQTYIEKLLQTGFQIRNKSKWFNSVSGFATREQINNISKMPFVKYIDVVKGYKKSNLNIEAEKQSYIPINKTPQPENLFSLDYGSSFAQVNQINVPAVHNLGFDGTGVTICVMDAGFNNLAHVVFNTIDIIATWDFVNGDPNVGDENDMGSGSHGTYVLSVLGGYSPGNLIGPAYRANYILAKTENTDSETPVEEDNWIAAMEWADSIGVDLTSTSLGYLEYDSPFIGYTWQDMDGNTALITRAADLAVKKGIVVVNSAGNEGSRGTPNTLMAPADGDSVIAIGGVDASGLRVSFSSYGPTVDGRIKPDFMALATGVVAARAFNQTQYTTVSGTSFSCPLTSGAIALLLQANPNLTPIQLRTILRQTSSRSNNPDNFYGWGIINTLSALNQVVGVDDNFVSSDFKLFQNYPNPFNPNTKISWQSPVSSWQTLKVYDVLGNEVATLVDEYREAGRYEVEFNAVGTHRGVSLPSGIYFYRLTAGSFTEVKKMVLTK